MEVQYQKDEQFPGWKYALIQYVVAGAFVLLLAGYWRLQIGQHHFYLEQAERNRTRNLPVIAPRGRILDREGRVLADNFPAFSVLLMRENAALLSPSRSEAIARGLRLEPGEVSGLVERTAKLPRFQPVVLKQAATMEDIAFVESHRVEYPELDLLQVQQRLYPKGQIAGAMLGYVGEVSEEMVAAPRSPYRPGDVVGKSGIEAAYNSILAGRDGMRRVIVNSHGQEVGSLTTIDARPGDDIRLTVDLDLEMVAEAALGEHPGAVVALDPRSGEVLALVSHPSFDPNDFAHRVDAKAWQRLMTDPMKPLLNKAIQSHLAPGSVFKIFTAVTALETGTVDPDFTVHCPGFITIYGHTYKDWTFEKGRGHGTVNLHSAIVNSCDVYFYTLGKMLGIDKLAFFAKRLGLGARTGIDLPNESAGLIPSPEWAQRVFKRKWWAGETISVAIGQGAVAVTPLQLAYAIGGVVSGGSFHRPHLAFRDQLLARGMKLPGEEGPRFPLKLATVEAVSRGMWGVVNEGGTGTNAHSPGLEISGKTGTAQVVSASLKESGRKAEFRNNAWFVGYAPSRDPEIVVSALVLQGEHSAVAAPVVRDVIKAYYDRKASRIAPQRIEQARAKILSQVHELEQMPPDRAQSH